MWVKRKGLERAPQGKKIKEIGGVLHQRKGFGYALRKDQGWGWV